MKRFIEAVIFFMIMTPICVCIAASLEAEKVFRAAVEHFRSQ